MKTISEQLRDTLNVVTEEYTEPKYMVMAGGGVGELQSTNNHETPQEAIMDFFKFQKVTPIDVSISGKQEAMEELIQWAQANKPLIANMMEKTGADQVYKKEVFINSIDDAKIDTTMMDAWGDGSAYPFVGG